MKFLHLLILFFISLCLVSCQEKILFKSPICDFSKGVDHVLSEESNQLIDDDKDQIRDPNSTGFICKFRSLKYKGQTSDSQEYTIDYFFMKDKLFCVSIVIPNIQKEDVENYLLKNHSFSENKYFYDSTKSVAIITGIQEDKNGVYIQYFNNDSFFQETLKRDASSPYPVFHNKDYSINIASFFASAMGYGVY